MSIADYKVGCTATGTTVCTSKGACCAQFTAVTGTAQAAANVSPNICIPAGTAVATGMTIDGTQTGIVAATMLVGGKGYPLAACPAATTGASTLAVSAVAAATAVYMM